MRLSISKDDLNTLGVHPRNWCAVERLTLPGQTFEEFRAEWKALTHEEQNQLIEMAGGRYATTHGSR